MPRVPSPILAEQGKLLTSANTQIQIHRCEYKYKWLKCQYMESFIFQRLLEEPRVKIENKTIIWNWVKMQLWDARCKLQVRCKWVRWKTRDCRAKSIKGFTPSLKTHLLQHICNNKLPPRWQCYTHDAAHDRPDYMATKKDDIIIKRKILLWGTLNVKNGWSGNLAIWQWSGMIWQSGNLAW